MTAAGIPTEYKSVRYRSLTEARWAAFFDLVGWKYTYEPFDANGYIPDFVIHGDRPLVVEVKPAVTRDDYVAAARRVMTGLRGRWEHDFLVIGVDPTPPFGDMGLFGEDRPVVGLLGERYDDEQGQGWDVAEGYWFHCLDCPKRSMSLHHGEATWAGRPCGHYRGDHHFDNKAEWLPQAITQLWAEAGNTVQWKPQAIARQVRGVSLTPPSYVGENGALWQARFRYSEEICDLFRTHLNHRQWSPEDRCWYVDDYEIGALQAALEANGFTVMFTRT